MKLVLKSTLYLLLTQFILYVLPFMYFNSIVQIICFFINIFVSWLIIKKVEKNYYKNYNKLSSALYMLCPVIGIIVTLYILYILANNIIAFLFIPLLLISLLIAYYIPLLVGIYLLNIIYIIIKKRKK